MANVRINDLTIDLGQDEAAILVALRLRRLIRENANELVSFKVEPNGRAAVLINSSTRLMVMLDGELSEEFASALPTIESLAPKDTPDGFTGGVA